MPTVDLATTPAGVNYIADPPGAVRRHRDHPGDRDGDVASDGLEWGNDAGWVDVGQRDDGDVRRAR